MQSVKTTLTWVCRLRSAPCARGPQRGFRAGLAGSRGQWGDRLRRGFGHYDATDRRSALEFDRAVAGVQWGGAIIGSHYFLSAQHLFPAVGSTVKLTTVTGPGPTTTTQTYTTIGVTNIVDTDIAVWEISGTFPSSSIVPLYSGAAGTELGEAFSMLGYGFHEQGSAVITGSTQNGWLRAGTYGLNGQKNFGTNTVGAITNDGAHGSEALVYDFTAGGATEAIDMLGDSGGGVFINVGGTEELAGLNYAVMQFYTAPNAGSLINAAIYDTTGLYVTDGVNFYDAQSLGIYSQYGYASEIAPYVEQIQAAMVPEPAGGVLLGLATLGLLLAARARRRRARSGPC